MTQAVHSFLQQAEVLLGIAALGSQGGEGNTTLTILLPNCTHVLSYSSEKLTNTGRKTRNMRS